MDAQKIAKRAEKRLEISKVMEERDIKECSSFARSYGRILLSHTHPDKLGRDPTVQDRALFLAIKTAHATLGNASKLRQYLNRASVHAAKLAPTTASSKTSTTSRGNNKKKKKGTLKCC